jgi:hypothetical protein
MPASPVIKGITTIKWGTGSNLGTPSGAIVESIRVTRKNGAPIEIEGNDGFAAALVFLNDGFNATITCLYDTAKTWPADGSAVSLTLPKLGAAGGTETFACWCASSTPDLSRKREATVTLELIYRPDVPAV